MRAKLSVVEDLLGDRSGAPPANVSFTLMATVPVARALEELRELTDGINPPILTERGLLAALDELCCRAELPTHLDLAVDRRPPDQIKSSVHFMASEALTDAAKHSHASEIRVLGDRLEALGARFIVSSPPGRGMRLRGEIPCG